MKSNPSIENASVGDKLMLAISSHNPDTRNLLERTAELTKKLGATWFVVHVKERATLHYGAAATEHPVPEADLDYARKLGAKVVVQHGNVVANLTNFARTKSIRYFITSRSRSVLPFSWRMPITEQLQRRIPGSILVCV